MKYLPTLLKIIENGFSANTTKVASYTKVLVDKLNNDGDQKTAEKILRLIGREAMGKGVSPAKAFTPPAMPVDRDSRFL